MASNAFDRSSNLSQPAPHFQTERLEKIREEHIQLALYIKDQINRDRSWSVHRISMQKRNDFVSKGAVLMEEVGDLQGLKALLAQYEENENGDRQDNEEYRNIKLYFAHWFADQGDVDQTATALAITQDTQFKSAILLAMAYRLGGAMDVQGLHKLLTLIQHNTANKVR